LSLALGFYKKIKLNFGFLKTVKNIFIIVTVVVVAVSPEKLLGKLLNLSTFSSVVDSFLTI
jgi:hypothetical protein